jgi:tRNA threonylcarbamoyladenosine biosynthesis protein TsaB
MSLILNIDTSSEKASIAVARNGVTIYISVNTEQRDHAGWIHQAIDVALKQLGEQVTNLKAIGVTSGPGSYTGLRVGMATAKGLCYALQIPLITINTLEAMTHAALTETADLFCPLIDARRMEVYTALYDNELNIISPPTAVVLHERSFIEQLNTTKILFFGSGRVKLQSILTHPNATFAEVPFDASVISSIINKNYNLSKYADLTYTEPVYLKEVYINPLNKS